ncbi:MAG: glycosyltransferase family 2 protein [Bacteroidales bacterium]
MISILLPIYNYNCDRLLKELHLQLSKANISFEIIAIEDGSVLYTEQNKDVCNILDIHYEKSETNIGRSAIRNLLASKANYDWLIFMDCDSRLTSDDYIANYIKCIKANNFDVICGGRSFGERSQNSDLYTLHWHYGTNREPKADKNNTGKAFLSNNFMIRKKTFNQIRFQEKLHGYGHEDTLFGIELTRRKIDIGYINNPVFHEGLDDNDSFISKSKHGLVNIRILSELYLLPQEENQIRILRLFHICQKFHLDYPLSVFYDRTYKAIEKQLKSKKPNLYLFDLYKLGFLCKVMRSDRPLQYKIDHQ